MKSMMIFVLCLSLTACFLFTKTVKLGEDFTVTAGETVKVQGTNLRLKMTTTYISEFHNPRRGEVGCMFEVTTNDKPERKQLANQSSMIVEGFYIKLQTIDIPPGSCRFIVTKAE